MESHPAPVGVHQLLAVVYAFAVWEGGERRLVTEEGVEASTLAMFLPQLDAIAKRTRVDQGPGLLVFDNCKDARQAAQTLASIGSKFVPYPVIWADVELPEIAPARDNGWNSVYTSPCSGVVKQAGVPAAVDRAEFNGFAAYITAHSKYKVGVYSAPTIWGSIFGTGSAASIPNTYEWTYWPETANLAAAPTGWCLHGSSTCAQFFGGQTSASKYALMWQWSGGGGVTNGHGDFDQIDVARLK